jgi:hypothetical protein
VETFNFALITRIMLRSVLAIYLGVAVGGMLSVTTLNEAALVDQSKSYVGSLLLPTPGSLQ